MGTAKVSYSREFDGYPVQLGKNGNRVEILQVIKANLDYIRAYCSQRLCVCHYVVRIPNVSESRANAILSNAMQSFKRTMLNRSIKAEYIWVREVGKNSVQRASHYHLAVIASGKQKNSAVGTAKYLNKLLTKGVGKKFRYLHICPPRRNVHQGAMLVSKEKDNFCDAFHWLSYLAKRDTKETLHYQKSFGYSKGYLEDFKTKLRDPVEKAKEISLYKTYRDNWVKQDMDMEKQFNVDPRYDDLTPRPSPDTPEQILDAAV